MDHSHEQCKTKNSERSKKLKKNIERRLSKIEGQIRGINKMIQNDVYCPDILNQVSAVEAALSSARNLILEDHFKSCVIEDIKSGKTGVIDEMMDIIKKISK